MRRYFDPDTCITENVADPGACRPTVDPCEHPLERSGRLGGGFGGETVLAKPDGDAAVLAPGHDDTKLVDRRRRREEGNAHHFGRRDHHYPHELVLFRGWRGWHDGVASASSNHARLDARLCDEHDALVEIVEASRPVDGKP